MSQFVEVDIRKPLFGNFCYIRDKILRIATRNHKMLKITLPQGEGIVDPKEWRKTGKKMAKVFKNPNVPMILWGNYVPIPALPGKVEEPKQEQQGLFS